MYAFVGVFLARILEKPSYLVVGGVDAAKNEELGYGIWLNKFKAILLKYTVRKVKSVFVVDNSLKENLIHLANYDGKNIIYLPTGYDIEFWKPMGPKEKIVLTVALVRNVVTWKVKGLDLLVDTARKLPDVSFIVVGVRSDFADIYKPPYNIKFIEPVRRENLLPLYQRAMVYCQPSRVEGLSNALCEAMACGCIPVATSVGGNPTAVGNVGILVPPDDSIKLAFALKKALSLPESYGVNARARIVSIFPWDKRKEKLLEILREEES